MTAVSGISDALSQVEAIEEQIEQLQSGELLNSALGATSTSGSDSTSASTSTGATTGTSSTAFAEELAAALGSDGDSTDAATSTDASYGSSLGTSDVSALLSSLSAGAGTSTGTSMTTLPSAASSLLTSDQRTFASTLAAKTGLNPGVVSAWLLAEESGGAAQSRQAEGNNDWLNIGYTGSGTYGASDSVWSDPTSAADATAEWLQGKDSIPGYGTASSGVQAILNNVGQSPATQIQALQDSGWAGSGYPSLVKLYGNVVSG
jgi:hypothetical protein